MSAQVTAKNVEDVFETQCKYDQDQPVCQISRSRVILFESYCRDTKTDTPIQPSASESGQKMFDICLFDIC